MQQIASRTSQGSTSVNISRNQALLRNTTSALSSRRQSQRHRFHTSSSVRAAASPEAATAAAAAAGGMATAWAQKQVDLPPMKRGCHVITCKLVEQLPEIRGFEVGLANFFILHTSAALTINENASPDVPLDLNDALDKIVPEGRHYRHLDEGLDDMPAHVKSSLMGPSLTIPIRYGKLALGTWQGIYLTEFRNHGGSRSVVVTLQGQKRSDGKSYSQY